MNAETELPIGFEALDHGFRWGRWAVQTLVGLVLLLMAFRIHLAAGYAMLFLVPLAIVVTGPPRARRILGLAYLVWLMAGIYTVTSYDPSQNLVASMVIGLVVGLIVVGATLWALIVISSQFVLALCPGATSRDARRQLWTLVTGTNYPYQIVEDGEVTISKPGGVLRFIGGPGIAVIKPGNAVVFERGGTITKIEGPGVARTRAFERIKQVVDLRHQWDIIEAEDVQTRDGIPLRLKAGVGYQIEPLENTERRLGAGKGPAGPFDGTIGGAHPVHLNNVFRAVYLAATSGWRVASGGAAELALRDAIGRRTLAEIYGQASGAATVTPTIIPQLEQEALDKARAWALEWGVFVTMVDILALEAPAEVRGRVLKQWEAEAQRGLITAKGEAEARVLDAIETVKLGARDQALQRIEAAIDRGTQILEPRQLERYLELLERLTTQMARDSATALRYIEALEQLSENPEARIILVPPGTGLTTTE
ncbi:MAG TPA: SPFH/Band 7/PHB domain protein [Anaerolineae bacterium]|nr:SPFH/Band 7/PHB domain protein [Anaerolineae bacterium]